MPFSLKRDAGICRENLTPELTPWQRLQPDVRRHAYQATDLELMSPI